MLFNSFTFILFLGVVLAVHYMPLPWRVRKFNLLLASYIFSAAWNPPFVVLLWISTLVDWFAAKYLFNARKKITRRTLLLLSLFVNLGLLIFFKYAGFLSDNFVTALHLLGFEFQPAMPDIILPMGISFYTFQTLSYTIDIYQKKARPWHSFLDYALYVTFFPQLVAGPIVRSSTFLPQCVQSRRATMEQLAFGLSLLILGLFQKVVLADALLAPIAELLYETSTQPNTISAWTGTLAFAGQIFCDFAGYSTCAIGVGMCLGFTIPQNFQFPYAAIGFSDFWRRWHISLSTWLRDYLYIPLGGNRKGYIRTRINIMLTMLIGGLWHGASWTFVAWGGLHGLFLIVERSLKRLAARMSIWQKTPMRIILALGTFCLVTIAWVFFRAKTFDHAFLIVKSMLGLIPRPVELEMGVGKIMLTFLTISLILITHWFMRDISFEKVAETCPHWLRATVLAGMIVAIATLTGEDRAFIYFQF